MDRRAWNERYDTTDLVWAAEPNRFLVAEAATLRPGRALDLGAGEGRNAVWLAQHGWDVTAVDFSDVGLAKAAQMADANQVAVNIECADVSDYEPPHHAFDLVIAFYLHLPADTRRPVHQRAAHSVALGGTLLIVGHDRHNLTAGYGGPQDPNILFTAADLVDDLVDSGLIIEKAEQARRKVPTAAGDQTAIDTLVRARRPQDR